MTNRYCFLVLLLTACLFTACNESVVYYHNENTSESGWGKSDRLTFDVNRQKSDVILQEEVSMRISNRFPFMRLTLIVEQTVYPAGNTMTDTLDCSLIDEQGVFLGYGTSQYQYLFPLKTIELHRGDSLHVAIRHDMKREILPGVTSVGIKIEKK